MPFFFLSKKHVDLCYIKNISNTRENQFKKEEQFVVLIVLEISAIVLARAW